MEILVYGWYHSNNIGDDLFIQSFKKLFPSYNFYFVKEITENNLFNIDVIIFGGGSFLDSNPKISDNALNIIKNKIIMYIGVGTETAISPIHKDLIKISKLIASRSKNIDNIKNLNSNIIQINDLVFSLKEDKKEISLNKNSILILPNSELLPTNTDSYIKNITWESFKSQFSQFLDFAIDNKYSIDFLSMCSNENINDNWAAREIINKMKNRSSKYRLLEISSNFRTVSQLISQYDIIITQRFHGIVLSEIMNKKYIAIHHHDKLKNCSPASGNFISYYEISKDKLIENFNNLNEIKEIDINFNELKQRVFEILNEK